MMNRDKGDLEMNKRLGQETDFELLEMVEVDDIDDGILEWLQQTPPVKIKEYGFSEPDSEEEYLAILNEISEYLMER